MIFCNVFSDGNEVYISWNDWFALKESAWQELLHSLSKCLDVQRVVKLMKFRRYSWCLLQFLENNSTKDS
jgi:hypothetical protein